MERKKINVSVWLPLISALALIVGYFLGKGVEPTSAGGAAQSEQEAIQREFASMFTGRSSSSAGTDKLTQTLNYINSLYVEPIDIDTLTEEFIPKVISKLDPHSLYIPAKDVMKANENLEGSFDGIGITFNMVIDTLVVLDVIPGGPSSKVGLEMGDRIIKVDGENIAGVKYDQNKVVDKLRGEGGSIVKLSVERVGFDKLIELDVVRGKVAINSVEAALMLKPTIGYIKLLRFSRTTHYEVVKAIDSLKLQGMKSLILDMKSNSGGYLDQGIYIANEFLPTGSMIVYTEGRGNIMGKQYADGLGKLVDQDLYILVDEFTASSSEIVTGAIQDNDRGTIIGRRTFGKGLVQQQVPLSDGSIVNITIARYHTPSGRCIQKPYELGKSDEYNRDIIERFNNLEYLNADSIQIADTVKYFTKSGRVVYGGGGIMPDIFVPLDTTRLNTFMSKAMVSMNIIKFVTKYAAAHKSEFSKLDSVDKLKAYLSKNENTILNQYIDYLVNNKVIKNSNIGADNRKQLLPYLSAYIGQYTPMGPEGFYSIIYKLDDITRRAVEEIENNQSINN